MKIQKSFRITWGQFKKAVEERGVADTDQLRYIDVDGYEGVLGVHRSLQDDGKVEVEIN